MTTDVCTGESCTTGETGGGSLTTPSASVGDTNIDPNAIELNNPGSGVGTLMNKIITILAEVIGALAFIGILVGVVQYITSGPNEAQSAKAKKTLIYSIIGEVLTIGSYFLFTAIRAVLQG